VLKGKIKKWLRLSNRETVLALAGYVYYLDNDFIKAEGYFCKCVEKNPKNIDNWVDLVFSLYHQGDKKNRMAKAILFNFDLFIRRFKTFKGRKCGLTILERIYKDLKGEKKIIFIPGVTIFMRSRLEIRFVRVIREKFC